MCIRDSVVAVHTGARCCHIQPHHAVAQLFHQLRNTAALAAQHQCNGAGQVVPAQRHEMCIRDSF